MTPPARAGRTLVRLAATPVILLGLLAGTLVAASPTVAAMNGTMVTLGDSVPSGMRCGCTPSRSGTPRWSPSTSAGRSR